MSEHSNAEIVPAGTKQQQGFGAVTLEKSAELAAVAVAAAAKAEVESAYVMALKRPRNEEDARAAIVKVCKNPTFAAKSRYRKPVGKTFNEQTRQWVQNYATGPSIRFAEEALRHWGNVLVQQTAIYDDDMKRIVKVAVKDLQSNLSYSQELALEKQVERRDKTGRTVIAERKNTDGKSVFIVKATEDELSTKQAAMASKSIRNNGLRLIPDYIIEEAMSQIQDTLASKVKSDPDAERRKLVDHFMSIGVKPSDLEVYLGHPLAQASTEELVELQEICTSIKDGHATWAEFIQAAKEDDGKQDELQRAKLEEAKAALKQKQEEKPAEQKPAESKPAETMTNQSDTLFDGVQIPDDQWVIFLKYLDSDPDRAGVRDAAKKKLKISKLQEVKSLQDRSAFYFTLTDLAKKEGVLIEWEPR